MSEGLGFFEREENNKVIKYFTRYYRPESDSKDLDNIIRSHSIYIAECILNDPKKWSECCDLTIKKSGKTLIGILEEFERSGGNTNERSYSIFLQLTCEFLFKNSNDPSDLPAIKNYAENNLSEFNGGLRSTVIYSLYAYPADLIKADLQSEDLSLLREFYKNKKDLEESTKNLKSLESKINTKIIEVNKLKKDLEEQKITYNFVRLNKGFQDLESKKKKESNANLIVLSLISLFMIAIPIIISRMYFIASDLESLLYLMPILSLELILIYFFRVVLVRFKEIKTQIMQLELRQALCQFIQNYADYSTEIKAKDSTALEKFENLIFSGITTNPENIPSTFDGIDQIARLIQSLKNSK